MRRAEVFEQQAGFRVVHIFVFDAEGRLLLQQLGRNRDRNPLKWGSSVAGYLNAGEDYLEAARRRLREELLLDTPLAKFGSAVMPDREARKFITLYVTKAEQRAVSVAEPDHIEALRFETVPAVRTQIEQWPENFTETFHFLFRFYLSTLYLTGVEEWDGLGGPVPNWNS